MEKVKGGSVMTNEELKSKIESNTLSNAPLVLKYSDSKFIAYQYAKEIAKKYSETVYINSMKEIIRDDIFGANQTLYIYDVEKLDENISPDDTDVIVICKSVPDYLEVDYVDMAKILPWMVESFVKMRLKGLSEDEIRWLCEVAKYDVYRLDQECKKLEIFEPAQQKAMFNQMNNENAYSDLNSLTIFNLTNALVKKDYNTIAAVLNDIVSIDVEGVGLITILQKQIKNLIDIQINPKNTATSLNMSPKQFNAIKYNVGKFRNDQLINIFEFLNDFDYKLKSGNLQFSNDTKENNLRTIDYIITNFLRFAK